MEASASSAAASTDSWSIQAHQDLKPRRRRRERLRSLHSYVARTAARAALSVSALGSGDADAEGSTRFGSVFGAAPGDCFGGGASVASHLSKRLLAAPRRYLAQLRAGASALAKVLGPPPQRPLEELDSSIDLLWAVDLAAACALGALVAFIWAFVCMPDGTADAVAMAEPLLSAPAQDGSRLLWWAKLVATSYLVVLVDIALDHDPLRSALLCAL
mmetsp:Transcript_75078/g.160874  ORF Transcript_75078/g.160874 Transcript_75078/m.160874 type:complete len:216 (+) Transcript_75078:75-722(+)